MECAGLRVISILHRDEDSVRFSGLQSKCYRQIIRSSLCHLYLCTNEYNKSTIENRY